MHLGHTNIISSLNSVLTGGIIVSSKFHGCLVNTLDITGLCNDTDIRLVNGTDQYEGRVEICFDNIWGTICDDSWSQNDGNVACQQLGYGTTGNIYC